MNRSRCIRLLFAGCLALLPALLTTAKPAWALQIRDTLYYSDASLTTLVGECYSNPCTSEFWCTGVKTSYKQIFTESCIPQQ